MRNAEVPLKDRSPVVACVACETPGPLATKQKKSMQGGIVYILSNANKTVFYIGFTTDIKRRIWEHKNKIYKGFTYKYNCTHLLYYATYFDMDEAMAWEKRMKRWKREWKIDLIKKENPEMLDLAKDWYDADGNIIY